MILASLLILVIDGDTLDIDHVRYRLASADAPELAQQCEKDNKQYPCGLEARDHLLKLLRGKEINCQPTKYKSYGRTIGICYADKQDLGEQMVRDGYAIASFSNKYKAQELNARLNRRGIWAGQFIKPQKWRREHD